MSIVIGTNKSALQAANYLTANQAQLSNTLGSLSSGSRLTNPSTDSGGLAVSLQLTATANRDSALINTIANAQSFLQTQNGALQVATSIVDRISQLVTMSKDPTLTSSNTANYNTEFSQLQQELSTIIGAKYNGISLFSTGSQTNLSVLTTNDLAAGNAVSLAQLTLGTTTGAVGNASNIGFLAGGTTDTNGAVTYIAGQNYSSLTSISASEISNFVNTIATFSATNGAEQSRLNFASQLATNDRTSLQSANSSISDTDIAQATTALAKFNVLVQAGTSMLTQANNSAQEVLKLITG
jgi:flagellin